MNRYSEDKQMMLEAHGPLGLLAMTVAHSGFRVNLISAEYTDLMTTRLLAEDKVRLQAFAAISHCSTNRMTAELIEAALNELEESLFKEDIQRYEDYINMYEKLCELAIDARD